MPLKNTWLYLKNDFMEKPFAKRSPCNNCPYRCDAPLRHWDVIEFINLIKSEADYFGTTFGCHKNDGNICIGWLMYQVDNDFPSIALRMVLLTHKITREYLESLQCSSDRYKTVLEMCIANYPEIFNN